MKKENRLFRSRAKSLAAQIRDAERRLSHHRGLVGIRAATLVQTIHEQMIAPASMLLAGGIGFILGEITLRPTPGPADSDGEVRAPESSPLMTAMNLASSVRALYTALPLAWMIKSYREANSPERPPEDPATHGTPSDSGMPPADLDQTSGQLHGSGLSIPSDN